MTTFLIMEVELDAARTAGVGLERRRVFVS